MPAIVQIQIVTPEAKLAFIEVVGAAAAIITTELGMSSGMYDVVFQSSDVEIGTGFVTLQDLLNQHSAGAGDGIVRVHLG